MDETRTLNRKTEIKNIFREILMEVAKAPGYDFEISNRFYRHETWMHLEDDEMRELLSWFEDEGFKVKNRLIQWDIK